MYTFAWNSSKSIKVYTWKQKDRLHFVVPMAEWLSSLPSVREVPGSSPGPVVELKFNGGKNTKEHSDF